uniref:Bone morphogenetic protein 3 n=1 Tax=Latimeria chalumnae TaxID=7897 RepID=H2ZXT9_LATCH
AGTIGSKNLHLFNLTSLTKSEDILSATLHYFIGDRMNSTHSYLLSRCCDRHGPRKHFHIELSVWSFASVGNQTRTLGHFLINVSSVYRDFLSWQWKDITSMLSQAKQNNELLVGIEIVSDGPYSWKKLLSHHSPYILVYANDSAVLELDSVVSSLQSHKRSLVHKLHKLENPAKDTISQRRMKRSTNVLLPLQNNELPGAEYQYNGPKTWEEQNPYKTLQARMAKRQDKKKRKNNRQKAQTLQFDEKTLKKARRKQWNEPRNCARRYLKVDFADIGWSEWIISPKSFDAYYCSGSCQFPMPKSLKPSNHATIQSIVRAVGVVPGIPEPCCVPEKMSSLSILFFDEDKNVVLKVYPNMTVQSCACR